MTEESLKLIVPKKIDNTINPEYRRHVKKFDMLSMPRMANKQPVKDIKGQFIFEMGPPLNKIDGGHPFFSERDKGSAKKKKKFTELINEEKVKLNLKNPVYDESHSNQAAESAAQRQREGAIAQAVAISKKREEDNQIKIEKTISEFLKKKKNQIILSSGIER